MATAKKCDRCGDIYGVKENTEFTVDTYVSIGTACSASIRTPDHTHISIDEKEHAIVVCRKAPGYNPIWFDLCPRCEEALRRFIENKDISINDGLNIGWWWRKYEYIDDITRFTCSQCDHTVTLHGDRVAPNMSECPNCKAKMSCNGE